MSLTLGHFKCVILSPRKLIYEKEVQRAVETFTALLEPILIIFLGAVVALLAVSVIEPLYGALGSI